MDRAWVSGRDVACGGPNRCTDGPMWDAHIVAAASTSILHSVHEPTTGPCVIIYFWPYSDGDSTEALNSERSDTKA